MRIICDALLMHLMLLSLIKTKRRHFYSLKPIRYNFVCLTLREAHKLKVSDNRVFRKIFDPKRNQVVREWRKLHSEKHRDFFFSPSIVPVINSRIMKWSWHVACMGGREMASEFW
jgi:hypothetical protein